MSDEAEFPELWRHTSIGEICETKSGGTPDRGNSEYYGGNIPWMKSGEMTDGIVREIEETITEKGLDESSATLFPKGTLVVALYGATSGKLGILDLEAATNQAVCGILPSKDVDRDYLFWYLLYIRDELLGKRKGGAQENLSQTVIRETEVPLPPLPEQRRIVAKIEELFSNLDAGRADLQTAQRQLERYRLSVLEAAVEGRLTAAWRRSTYGRDMSRPNDVEPADALLDRILDERRKQWEKQYRWERYDSKGKEPPSGWKSRYKEPVKLEDESDLDQLPSSWKWISLHHLCRWSNGDGLPKKERDDGPYPVYGGNGVTGSHSEYMIETSAVVVGRVGAHCGNVHLAPSKSWVTDNAIYSKWKSDLVNERFLLAQLRTKRLNQLAGGSGQPYISQKVLKSLPIALPPLAEQKEIADEVERLLSVADDAAQTTEREHTRAERLRQSILKQAFSGQLVPHEKGTASAPAPSGNGTQRPGEQIELEL